jgi:transposase
VSAVEQIGNAPGHSVVRVHLERVRKGSTCGGCGKLVSGAQGHSIQELRHLTLWQHQTILRFPRYRAICPDCGVRTEALEFADVRGPRVTRALSALIYDLCKVTTVKAVALLFGLHRRTVKELDKEALGRFKKTLSGKKFVLLKRRAQVRGKAREALDAVLAASPKLLRAHLLKESFGRLWNYRYKGCAKRFWEDWKAQLKWQRMPSYRRFVKLVERHWEGMLAFCDKKVSLGYIESANLKARNAIRRAYGYRDKEYMKLKIIQACTLWMAQFRPWTATHSSVP